MSNFRVGQKVVCVQKPLGGYGDEHFPVVGETYTIREILPGWDGKLHCRLNEIVNGLRDYDGCDWGELVEASWRLHRFRPLITPEQDIALFHALCPGLPVVPPAVVPKRVPVPSPSD